VTILDDIVRHKKQEVEKHKKEVPLNHLMQMPNTEVRDFKKALQKQGISIIAEIKKKSPSAGMIRENFDPKKIAQIYERYGASAISVLTDATYFGGKTEHLIEVKNTVQIPVLRKEFIIDTYQVYESRAIGADAILLIAGILSDHQLKSFLQLAKEIGLSCLVEVHNRDELFRVLHTNADVIGINNRDLKTFNVNIQTSLQLKMEIPDPIITVSESGIHNREDVELLEDVGFDGILVGESLVRSENIGEKLLNLIKN
jgi:indole-3-glycerol phosphate synthase